ncbi:acyltransferase [Marinobacter caseinilyticus]|uniref:acyltransferase n=1 Tax=Marinobacter caseinilyticus TaxID=2692195 RepID=UPI001F3C00D3|nr:acyltransferase [Marinobacter caseinilyticus]
MAQLKVGSIMNFRGLLKRSIKNAFLLLAMPVYACYWLLAIISGSDSAFQTFSQTLSLIPGKVGIYSRAAFYRLACPNTSDDISIGFLTVFSHRDTSIHRGVYIGPQCNIGKCTIGTNTLIGSGVHILSGSRQHEFSNIKIPIQDQGGRYKKIEIGENCWLGNQALVMEELKPHTIVAAGSVVTKPSNSGDILAGNPARLVKSRFASTDGVSAMKSDTGAL